jgi:hypothetical protein
MHLLIVRRWSIGSASDLVIHADWHDHRFVASAWHKRPASMPSYDAESIKSDYSSPLERISNELPVHFHALLNKLKMRLPLLFTDSYPIVINHGDLLENNIHVDAETGRLTGIVDWRDAKIAPFATQLWGLENILGIRGSTCMRFHPSHVELRGVFWETFYNAIGDVPEDVREAIRTARMIGIFLANGDFGNFPSEEKERELAVLESMISNLPDIEL